MSRLYPLFLWRLAGVFDFLARSFLSMGLALQSVRDSLLAHGDRKAGL